jgi:hypothetical protein
VYGRGRARARTELHEMHFERTTLIRPRD